jgi:hypothetical protein
MGALVMAWLVGEGIIVYRHFKGPAAEQDNATVAPIIVANPGGAKSPPGPGQLVLSSGVFVLLALLAESEKARPIAVTLAWGFDIAAFMNLFGVGTPATGGTWPPPIAPNTVLLPSGTSAASAAASSAPTTTNSGGGALSA